MGTPLQFEYQKSMHLKHINIHSKNKRIKFDRTENNFMSNQYKWMFLHIMTKYIQSSNNEIVKKQCIKLKSHSTAKNQNDIDDSARK